MSDDLITSNELLNAEDLSIAEQQRYEKKRVRKTIETNGGDTLSLLGTTSNATQICLYLIGKMIKAGNYADFIKSIEDEAPHLKAFVEAVDSGDINLPYQLEGIESSMAEIKQRANAVSDALANNQPNQE